MTVYFAKLLDWSREWWSLHELSPSRTVPRHGSVRVSEDATGSSVRDGFGARQSAWACSGYSEAVGIHKYMCLYIYKRRQPYLPEIYS